MEARARLRGLGRESSRVIDGKSNEFVFYDGPPFANGLPHYGHIVTGFVKDIVPRYQTMRGTPVERRFGWDCHGLPAELAGREGAQALRPQRDILEYGIGAFQRALPHDRCMQLHARTGSTTSPARRAGSTSTTTTGPWTSPTWRASCGRSRSSGTRAWSTKAIRVVPYSLGGADAALELRDAARQLLPRCARTRRSPSRSVQAASGEPVRARSSSPGRRRRGRCRPTWRSRSIPTLDYAVLREGRRAPHPRAKRRVEHYAPELEDYARSATVKGAELVGRSYEPLFPFFADDARNAFVVIAGRFRRASSDGTGVVHIAPAFGEDDLSVAEAEGMPIVDPGRHRGQLHPEVPPTIRARTSYEANKDIIRDLKAERASCCATSTYDHNYPHCWRTDQPLIYRAMNVLVRRRSRRSATAWSSSTRASTGCLRTSATGSSATGSPMRATGTSRRNRFWGAPIPVWMSDDPKYPRIDVYGSLDEIERDFGVRPLDLHRPDDRRADASEPGRSDRQVDDAARARSARLLVRIGLDAVRPAALPVREQGAVRREFPRRLHRRIRRPRRAAGSTR